MLLDLIVKARAEASTCHRYKRQMVNTLISQIFITMLENHEYDIEVPEFNLAGKKNRSYTDPGLYQHELQHRLIETGRGQVQEE
jgi:hypothetical protein